MGNDPTAALIFNPPKDSDELYEALKVAFPHVNTHKGRMREAVIDFYVKERENDRLQPLAPRPQSFSSVSPMENWINLPTTGYLPSPESSMESGWPSPTQTFDYSSGSTSQSQSPPMAQSISEETTKDIKDMTGVFTLNGQSPVKVHKRRCMTDQEKKKYRRKRLEGACADCKKRKRKVRLTSLYFITLRTQHSPLWPLISKLYADS